MLALLVCATSANAAEPSRLICCGADEVFLIDRAEPGKKIWSWRASDSPSIAEKFHRRFRSTDDCKPYSGNLLLITSSSDGVALIDRETKKARFFALARNAHSACLLPNRELAVAASTGGDEVQFFSVTDERKPALPEQKIPLKGAHGVVWDSKRDTLWALGTDELLEIVSVIKASLARDWQVVKRHVLPDPGGHDLSPLRDGKTLLVTSGKETFLFDRDTRKFSSHATLGKEAKVKSVDEHPVTEEIVWHQAAGGNWWSDTIRFVGGKPIQLKGERLYKIRWDAPDRNVSVAYRDKYPYEIDGNGDEIVTDSAIVRDVKAWRFWRAASGFPTKEFSEINCRVGRNGRVWVEEYSLLIDYDHNLENGQLLPSGVDDYSDSRIDGFDHPVEKFSLPKPKSISMTAAEYSPSEVSSLSPTVRKKLLGYITQIYHPTESFLKSEGWKVGDGDFQRVYIAPIDPEYPVLKYVFQRQRIIDEVFLKTGTFDIVFSKSGFGTDTEKMIEAIKATGELYELRKGEFQLVPTSSLPPSGR